ncbi:DUF2505 domain-containing protein [Hoyosella altamirensis]|uniref:DUF2505 domain-containing protein n=1 Tax=Hoyosella altamirensis TaxID=616997 RepID=A0A839RNJ0_9ACTN|nr:DUF2505 domain-containing protein [Hoyosella altamirensis]MBB3037501.1 hypothetical protein [Hoyosella altamirensis]
MARRTEYHKEFPFPAEKVFTAIATKQYWEDRLAAVGGTNARVTSFSADDSGITVELEQFIPRSKLPSVAQTVIKNDMVIERKESWTKFDGTSTGELFATMKGGPGNVKGTRTLKADGDRSVVDATVEGRVSVPIVGGKLEKLVLQSLVDLYEKEDKFTADWIEKNL